AMILPALGRISAGDWFFQLSEDMQAMAMAMAMAMAIGDGDAGDADGYDITGSRHMAMAMAMAMAMDDGDGDGDDDGDGYIPALSAMQRWRWQRAMRWRWRWFSQAMAMVITGSQAMAGDARHGDAGDRRWRCMRWSLPALGRWRCRRWRWRWRWMRLCCWKMRRKIKYWQKLWRKALRYYNEIELPRLSQPSDFERPGTSQTGAHVCRYASTMSKEPVLYTGEDAEGFDMTSGQKWIYPTNYPVREYQYNIVKSALFKNTLVSLPTGLGKTFIAAVVMYNFYRWFPRGKVIFLAPTKPLVHQQIDSCYKVMGIPQDDTAEMTGNMSPSERARTWEMKRVFFLTPQVLTNDLTRRACPAASIKCIVVDEAHKAMGNHSYCQVMKALFPFNNKFRVLALSATPGSDMGAVMQVMKNLLISHIELRNEESPDIAEFTHKRNLETIVVSLGPYLSDFQQRYLNVVGKYLGYLQRQKVLIGNMLTHTKFGLLQARDAFPSFAICVTLLHSLELLSQYGLRSFLKFLDGVLQGERGQAVVQGRLKHDVDLENLLGELKEKLGTENQAEPEPDISMAPSSTQLAAPYVYSHPKLEKLQEVVVDHFKTFKEKNVVTRAMIFCQYRDTVIEVCHILQKFHPLVKPMTFIGQSTSGKSSRGFTQKQQLTVMRKFISGGYNTLIATCVGEEGLDIGEVDLIVCYDAHKSPIRLVQRMGRTGRKREGRIVMLITEGKEHNKYKSSMYQNRTINKKLLGIKELATHLYGGNPRMIPNGIHPQSHQMFMTVPDVPERKTNKKKSQDIRKLFGTSIVVLVTGLLPIKKIESSSPYCTVEDLEEMRWDGKFIPQFNLLTDSEEMHAKDKISELISIVSSLWSTDC
ncbi:hypothetical protein L9F63_013085, partial [Diploptera punctata]